MRIATTNDVERARRDARTLARELGFGKETAECVALATAELAANLLRYAIRGELLISAIDGGRAGVLLESQDQGPGIADLDAARQDGFTTGSGLGGGLGSVERLMDECSFRSGETGTSIVARKWADPR